MKLKPGDIIRSKDGIEREIVDVRPTGYGWKYRVSGFSCGNVHCPFSPVTDFVVGKGSRYDRA